MTAVVIHGLPALLAILVFCALACLPVWVGSLLLRDVLRDWHERRFRRKMAELGRTPEQIEADWQHVLDLSKGRSRADG